MIGHLLCACMFFHLGQFICVCYCVLVNVFIIYCKYYGYWKRALHGTSSAVRALTIWLSQIKLLLKGEKVDQAQASTV